MNIGDRVKVKGISQKGKTRVKEHGEEWEIFGFNEFMRRIGLKSVKTNYRRWVDTIEKDEDFEIM